MFTRLSKATHLDFDQKYPIVLPANCTISYLIIRNEHARLLHAGIDRTMKAIRNRYFIFNLRRMAKRVRRSCYICKLIVPSSPTAPYGALPSFRVDITSTPFSHTGLDLFGPLKVNTSVKSKLYGLILTCATTRDVHLELLENMTAEEVYLGLRRFMARRGIPQLIYSDNGTQLMAI